MGKIEPLPFIPPPLPSIPRKQARAVEAVRATAAEASTNTIASSGERAKREQTLQASGAGKDASAPGTTRLGLCRGDAPCWLNIVCCPFVMVWQSFAIYVLGCCGAYTLRCMRGIFCCACRTLCRRRYNFRDKGFPPVAASIGAWRDQSAEEVAAATEWVRAAKALELAHGPGSGRWRPSTKLFEGKIEPRDIAQGGIGDCWLMAALACLAEHPNLLRHSFCNAGRSERGQYYVRLFDGRARKWHKVVIDDYVPVDKASRKPLFATPHGHEIWVLLIEKAFAKWCGSYKALDGGHEMWAFEALTGGRAFTLKREAGTGRWRRYDLAHQPPSQGLRAIGVRRQEETHAPDDMFALVRTYARRGALLSASIANAGEEKRACGLVAGHAYSVLDAKWFTGRDGAPLRLVQLRNPWGQSEWNGAWADGAAEWAAQLKIKRLIRPTFGDDGAFWMSWEDFQAHYDGLDICSRDRGLGDLALNLHEADGSCFKRQAGPLLGCLGGCASFWCCCLGCRALYCRRRATEQTVAVDRGKDDDLLDQVHIAVTRSLGIDSP